MCPLQEIYRTCKNGMSSINHVLQEEQEISLFVQCHVPNSLPLVINVTHKSYCRIGWWALVGVLFVHLSHFEVVCWPWINFLVQFDPM